MVKEKGSTHQNQQKFVQLGMIMQTQARINLLWSIPKKPPIIKEDDNKTFVAKECGECSILQLLLSHDRINHQVLSYFKGR